MLGTMTDRTIYVLTGLMMGLSGAVMLWMCTRRTSPTSIRIAERTETSQAINSKNEIPSLAHVSGSEGTLAQEHSMVNATQPMMGCAARTRKGGRNATNTRQH